MPRLLLPFICFTLITGCADKTPVSGPYPKFGMASWYVSRRTATGERYERNSYTCAMRKKDYGKYYKISNLANNKSVVVRHNNFGPSKRLYRQGRIIDLSQAAFAKIADLEDGIIIVMVSEEESTDQRP